MESGMPGGSGPLSSALVVGLIVVIFLVRRNLRPRPLRIERLWVRPVLFALIVGTTITASAIPLDPLSLVVFVLAVLVGAGLGWQRGRLMRIDVHPETHDLTVRASPLGIVLIIGVLGLKLLLRGSGVDKHSLLGIPATGVADGVVLLLGTTMVAQSLEMWLRARRLLTEAQAARGTWDTSNF